MNPKGSKSATDLAALEMLAALLLERAGLKITPDGYYGLRLALQSRMPALGITDAAEYVKRLRGLTGEHELRSLLPLVTVGKTSFFRDTKQFLALEKQLMPDFLARANRENRKCHIWSAGCATGEEPYSVAMIALDLGATAQQVDIWATDLNPAAVDSAKEGVFPARRMTDVSRAHRAYFEQTPRGMEVRAKVKSLIRFDGLNLAAPVFPGLVPETFDLVLCRNVIIYFDLPTIRTLMQKFWDVLRPGGVLLLGYSESLFRVYDRFEMFEVEGSFAYRRPWAGAPGAPIRSTTQDPRPPKVAGLRLPNSTTPPLVNAPTAPSSSAKRSPVDRLHGVKSLVEEGKFVEALASVQALTHDEPDDLPALLTQGNIRSLLGQAEGARESFQAALAREPLCVEARLFAAMAAFQAGQMQEAQDELTKALFLEPTLAIGHYLLAQVNERQGDHDAARRAYRNVLAQVRFQQRPLAGHYPDLFQSVESIAMAARYALAALSEDPTP